MNKIAFSNGVTQFCRKAVIIEICSDLPMYPCSSECLINLHHTIYIYNRSGIFYQSISNINFTVTVNTLHNQNHIYCCLNRVKSDGLNF